MHDHSLVQGARAQEGIHKEPRRVERLLPFAKLSGEAWVVRSSTSATNFDTQKAKPGVTALVSELSRPEQQGKTH